MMDPTGEHISTVSAAVEHDGCLFLGNLNGDYVSYVDVATEVRTHWALVGGTGRSSRKLYKGVDSTPRCG